MPETIIRQLKSAWTVGGQNATEVEFREPTVVDLIDAERDANPALGPNAFNVALACRTCVRAGTFTGPFVAGHFHKMKAKNWYVVREAMQEAEALGED